MTIFYVEKEASTYPKTKSILDKYKEKRVIYIDRYSEIFNRNNQNFDEQKKSQAIILAVKKEGLVQKNPDYCVSEYKENYYFSTSLNCIFDCSYCFLRGMYRSAYLVFFVNIDDFKNEIGNLMQNKKNKIMFFANYDNDGLALDNISEFSSDFIPWFSNQKNALLEIRTKSSNIGELIKIKSTRNTIISFTLSPNEIQKEYENKSATLKERIKSIKTLQNYNFKIGIRIEPIIYCHNFEIIYSNFFDLLKKEIDFSKIENIYFGVFKIPKIFLKKMKKLNPYSKLLHGFFKIGEFDQMTYEKNINRKIERYILNKCEELIEKKRIYFRNISNHNKITCINTVFLL